MSVDKGSTVARPDRGVLERNRMLFVGVSKTIYYFCLLFKESGSQCLGVCKTITSIRRDRLFIE